MSAHFVSSSLFPLSDLVHRQRQRAEVETILHSERRSEAEADNGREVAEAAEK